jgi:hypothetical protein
VEWVKYFENYVEVAREIKEMVNRHVKARVFVFGSAVRGDYVVGLSDIDVAVVSEEFEDREKRLKVYDELFSGIFIAPLNSTCLLLGSGNTI